MQQHLRICVNVGRKLRVTILRLTDEEVLLCQAPVSTTVPLIEDPQLHECKMCGEQLKSAEFLKSHKDLHLTQIPGEIKCAFGSCDIIFTSPVMLKEHREKHYQALQFSCEVCGAVFNFKVLLKRHVQQHHTQERTFACDVLGCTYTCRIPQLLRSHQKTVHYSIDCTCHLCGKIMKTNNLKNHMLSHYTETPGVYRCLRRNCKLRLFQNGDELIKHTKEYHDVVKPFKCDVCGKCFATKNWLREHVIIHTDQRLCKCDVKGCSYSGKTKGNLRNHKRVVHSFTHFTCSHCARRLKCPHTFKRHL
jgi:uncharacterized Zn-finger protein